MNHTLCEGIEWVGHVDWTVRDFHGYKTNRGSSYNAYLVRDDKVALIDTVKAAFAEELLAHVAELVSPSAVDYVVCNHAEPDHSGGLPLVLAACTNAELVCDAKCQKTLQLHYNTDGWKWKIVADGDTISLGRRTLTFIETPMVHWPESMFTYVPEEKLLFSMDAFGQHYAAAHRFDDEEPIEAIMAEAKTYFANIVMLYGKPIAAALDKAAGLEIAMIAPSHGVIWRKHLDTIIAAYKDWVVCKPVEKALVIYDTMWKSTELMAQAIAEGVQGEGVDVRLINMRVSHITDVATEMLDAAAAAVGSPTLNKTLMPQAAASLTYLKGLGPRGKAGFAFGSYGWSKGGARDVEDYLKAMKFEILRDPLQAQFVPKADALDECRAAGKLLADAAKRIANA
jgi:flavorubredoxin